jgi:TolB-like protein/Tfp pilus assembly protein PilF
MGEEPPKPAGAPTGAVFLSYASQDADPARKICDALRAAGVEVWFDQSELRGGDAWDRQIRKQIHDCTLFIPVISAHSDARREGYFRREWKLAVERTADMAEDVSFLVPVAIDSTPEATARVPDRFREVQWSRLPDGQPSGAFIERVRRLLCSTPDHESPGHLAAPSVSDAALTVPQPVRGSSWSRPALLVTVGVVVFAALALLADKFWVSKSSTPSPAAFTAPAHSIAVLPFVNLSGDASQDYFSDGLTEELLNSLAEIDGLQVAARTSSFSFKEHPDIATVAHKLNVGAVLEGSVRRSEHTVRVTAQLINAVTGFHLWSKTYDRDLGDVLKLQTEIANAVAGALKVTLLGDEAARIELGATHNPAAFDAYLRGAKALRAPDKLEDYQTAIAAFGEAVRLDANYALAFAARSLAYEAYARDFASRDTRESFDRAQADALQALALAPDLAEGHLALARFFTGGSDDFPHAQEAFARAVALAPGNARAQSEYGRFLGQMGRFEAAVAAGRRALILDPLNPVTHQQFGETQFLWRHYEEAAAAFQDALALDPQYPRAHGWRGLAYYALGKLESARSACEANPDFWQSQTCLAIAYHKLGRRADAEAVFAKLLADGGDSNSYQYVEIYAQWGDAPKALDWLAVAVRVRDPGLALAKNDVLMDPLRKEPRFQAVIRELKFPQ